MFDGFLMNGIIYTFCSKIGNILIDLLHRTSISISINRFVELGIYDRRYENKNLNVKQRCQSVVMLLHIRVAIFC